MLKMAQFEQNGDFLGYKSSESLMPENVHAYIAQYGEQAALGYFHCLHQMIDSLTNLDIETKNMDAEQIRDSIGNIIKDRNKTWSKLESILGEDVVYRSPKIHIDMPNVE